LTAAVADESITPTDERVSAEFVRAEARPAAVSVIQKLFGGYVW
jgi:hypothetical protein